MKQTLNHANHFAMLLMALAMAFTFLACEKKEKKEEAGTFKTVKIGSQTWMAENLNIETADSWCYNNDNSNCAKYGRLYTWNAAMKVCPSGWHLPSNEEWTTLMETVGGVRQSAMPDGGGSYVYYDVGKKLKSKIDWNDYEGKSGNGTDEFGFSALPGGDRKSNGSFEGISNFGYWWSATGNKASNAYDWNMNYNSDYAYKLDDGEDKINGYSVRCVQGEAEKLDEVVQKTETEQTPKTEAECTQGKIGSPITVEATFLKSECGDSGCDVVFLLSNGEELWLTGDENLEKGDKVSVTYQKRQYWESSDYAGGKGCMQDVELQSVKILSKAAKEPIATEGNCPDKEGPLQTAEATFLEHGGGHESRATFRLADGSEIDLITEYTGDAASYATLNDLKKGDKVSITYKEEQGLDKEPDVEVRRCLKDNFLTSVKKLPK
jgi:uncharacterized protein (TIGR02145 family)